MTETILRQEGTGGDRLAAGWLRLAVASLMLAGLTAVLVALGRTPGVQALVGPAGFRVFLVGHVNFSLTVWCLSFLGAIWAWLAARGGFGVPGRMGRPALGLAAAGTAMMAVSTVLAQGRPQLVDYLPLLIHPVFELGLLLFLGGSTLMAVGFLAGTTRFPIAGAKAGAPDGGHARGGALPEGHSFPVLALRVAAMAEISAAVALLCALTAGWRGDWGAAAWGGGHLLQVANAAALVGCWWLLLAPEEPAPNWLRRSLLVFLVPCIGIPVLYLLPGDTPVAWIRDLNWSCVAIPMALSLILALRAALKAERLTAPGLAALTSLLLFSIGFGMALLGLEGDTRVTAHYHGTVGAVTVAFMGLAFRFLPDLNFRMPFPRLARVLPQVYGFGLMLLIGGLYWASFYGGQRKVFETFAHQRGLWGPLVFFGLGAVVTVVAGVLFIWVLGWACFGRRIEAGSERGPARALVAPASVQALLPALVLLFVALPGAAALAADRQAAPDFQLSDQHGRLVRLADLRGKPVVLTFLYTQCPDTCPRTLGLLADALKGATGSAQVVTVTVDPERDDRTQLSRFAAAWPAGWVFLTGPPAKVAAVWARYGVSVSRDEETGHRHHGHHMGYTITHSNVVVVIDAAGRVVERISGGWNAGDVSAALASARSGQALAWTAWPLAALRDFLDRCGALASRNPLAFTGLVALVALPGVLLPLVLFRTFLMN